MSEDEEAIPSKTTVRRQVSVDTSLITDEAEADESSSDEDEDLSSRFEQRNELKLRMSELSEDEVRVLGGSRQGLQLMTLADEDEDDFFMALARQKVPKQCSEGTGQDGRG